MPDETYVVTLQVVVAVEDIEEWQRDDLEALIQEASSYTVLAPWEADVIAVVCPALNDGTVRDA